MKDENGERCLYSRLTSSRLTPESARSASTLRRPLCRQDALFGCVVAIAGLLVEARHRFMGARPARFEAGQHPILVHGLANLLLLRVEPAQFVADVGLLRVDVY